MRAAAIALALLFAQAALPPSQLTWRLDNLVRFGADTITLIGQPSIVETDIGAAVQFNGRSDGLLIRRNPIAGLRQFTIEVLLSPDPDGPEEQRFLHIAEPNPDNRALIELRLAAKQWSLDSYLRYGSAQLTLLDRAKLQAAGRWRVAAMTFDAGTLRHYIDGVEQGSGSVAFEPLGAGVTSIGVRQNLVSWFKGRIHTVRVTAAVLKPQEFLTPQRASP